MVKKLKARSLTEEDVDAIKEIVRDTVTHAIVTACEEHDGTMPPEEVTLMRVAALVVVAIDRTVCLRDELHSLNQDYLELIDRLQELRVKLDQSLVYQ